MGETYPESRGQSRRGSSRGFRRFGSSGGLGKFFFYRRAGKARLDLADRAAKLRPGLKVLFTSGYTENTIVHNGRLDPGVQLISKPYGREQLAQKLRSVLGQV